MHELDDDSAFADARSDALHRAVTYITNDKYSGHIGFQQAGVAIQRPRSRPLPVAKKVGTGKNEAALVAINRSAKPFRARLRADENEEA